jgi:hypothetical protein
MGQKISKLMNQIFGSKEMRLLMLGLDAAGKTSAYFTYILVANAAAPRFVQTPAD